MCMFKLLDQPGHKEVDMTQLATITARETSTPGDGAPITATKGRVKMDLAPDSATLRWEAAEDVAGLTAVTCTHYEQHVKNGKITPGATKTTDPAAKT